jgi:uncharacterized protein (DUF433 family)
MANVAVPTNGYRTHALYTFTEAAHLAGVSTNTVKNWLFGYTTERGDVPPLFKPAIEKKDAMVSFLQLVELVVAARFRKAEHVPFETVRRAYQNAQQRWTLEYPFAHLRLEAIGGHIVHRLREEKPGTSVQSIDAPEQWTIPGFLLDTIAQFQYELDLVSRWYPVGKQVPIVVDPKISTGLPTIVDRGVTIGALQKRWKAGWKIDFIARDFDLETDTVEEALQYADRVAV